MARIETIVVRNSDLSGEVGANTVKLSTITVKVPGFVLDLTPAEAAELRESEAEFTEAVRELSEDFFGKYLAAHAALTAAGAETKGGASTTAAPATDTALARQWARQNGYAVGDRGRLAPEIVSAFNRSRAEVAAEADGMLAGTYGEYEPSAADLAAIAAE